MPIDILMPALSPTMTEGNLAKWVKQEGDAVKAGDVICEIETDKATMEVEAVDEGTLAKIIVAEGTQGVKVNEVIALLLEEGESADALGKAPAPKSAPAPENPKTEPAKAEAPKAEAAPAPKPAAAPDAKGAPADHGDRVFATPLARRMAEQAGVDLAGVKGSGPNGRIVKSDIEAAAGKPKQAAAPAVAEAPKAAPTVAAAPAAAALTKDRVVALAGNVPYTEIPNTSMRKVIAKRLTEAKQTVPHFYLTVDCEIDQLLKIRAELNSRGEGLKISVNDFVIRASALALKKVPAANASWSDDVILQWSQADIAVAVAIDGGLITPIIKQAEAKGLATISSEMRDLGARAKAGKLKLEEFQGGTFSISNLGMFGIKEFSAVINPPHGAILAVGAGEQRPVVKNGALAIATVMSCTLSVDHRVVDGAVGAAFLKAFKGLIEDPLSMLL
ncbi:MAG: pyruvate dehydrogenase complex dihydrolipoamide acetyltransferase [Rhodospirillales bacterium]|nr:pyruvate dehydrogenase complex dihydrolipoamide acetyltransferase [Rhodospirillales bacterium]